jgi:CRISPR-associated exonuclease Cas4
MLEYSRNLKEPSRELRKNMTDAERVLWARLRGKQLCGVQFYRQKPLGPYIVDFYAHAAGLVIEVDGGQHYEPEHARRDSERDRYLSERGVLVMRFSNLHVLQETDAVVEAIHRVIEERQIPPAPPLQRGEKTKSPSLQGGKETKSPPADRMDSVGPSSERVERKSPPLAKGDSGGFDSDPIMLSALEHYAYCPRQCALIHVEQVWDENLYTMRGRDVHENVDDISSHELSGVRFERALPIWNRRLGLVGKADLVEFHGDIPYPVEYKSGRKRRGTPETTQLCAQALCLEEMFGVPVEKGALYWHGSRERREVTFTDEMRERVEELASALHGMIEARLVPPPVNDRRCDDCSLRDSCLPDVIADKERSRRSARDLFEVKQ